MESRIRSERLELLGSTMSASLGSLPGSAPLEQPTAIEIMSCFRSPLLPELFARLEVSPSYMTHIWPAISTSVDTAGFLASALYLADMSLDAVESVYTPISTRNDLLLSIADEELVKIEAVLDVFQYLQPQVLLIGAALAEGFEQPVVGGGGRIEPRQQRQRESQHLVTEVPRMTSEGVLISNVAKTLQLSEIPQIYGVLAHWPAYLEKSWSELQHLSSYPEFRRRGRALYYYARSSARFLSEELHADPDTLLEAGVTGQEIDDAREIVESAIPALAMMVMHCSAMRLALGYNEREVIDR